MIYDGVLPVLKPTHWTSHDVVARIRRIIGVKRVGHTGTLDPLVTGVLPICIGRATRMVEYIQELPKTYEATLTIGYSTDTEDASGTVIHQINPRDVVIDELQIQQVLPQFLGDIEQIPPMYSAVKVNGQKLYTLARKGVDIERPTRQVTIHQLSVLSIDLQGNPYPQIKLRVTCSKGTYIRTLSVDIGKALGYPAVMSDLVRTESGGYTIEQAVTLEEIAEHHDLGTLSQILISPDQAVQHLPSITFDEQQSVRARNGLRIHSDSLVAGMYRVYDHNQIFIGLFRAQPETEQLKPEKVWT
jgi:tRNA pseudouridine55 synthase